MLEYPTNISGMVDLGTYVNSVTNSLAFTLILIAFNIVLFLILKNSVSTPIRAFTTSTFLCSFLCIFMWILGLVNWLIMVAYIIITSFLTAGLYLESRYG